MALARRAQLTRKIARERAEGAKPLGLLTLVPLYASLYTPHSAQGKTRGRVVRYSFLVRLFHPLFHAG
jgi:hypothetical protein